ncbi:MAG: protein kinase, partial [Candidatus Hydrogenedentes bacterium]|nr:protein kinase [Candidatus Hydrogenedentota bacterium]
DLALKTLLPQFVTDKMLVERFLNEARITRKLAHPNIVRVHDIGMTGKGIYISMEYVQGDSLRGVLEKQRTGNRLPVRQVLHIIDQLCIALDYAHQYTIHRDIKPENVMITKDNHIKLMDFGISKLMDKRFATSASLVMGTPYYMSPEQQRSSRDVDARADVYSVGVVLYEMLTGNVPTGVPKAASEMIREIPPAMDDIITRCVEPDIEKRFKSAAELREAIHPIIKMLDEGKNPARILTRKPYARRNLISLSRQHLTAVLAIVIILAGVGAGLWALDRWNTKSTLEAMPAPMPSSEYGTRFEELMAMIDATRGRIEAISEATHTQRKHLESAEAYLQTAEEKVKTDRAAAIGIAEAALQQFLAALLNPRDMIFIPAGQVTVNDKRLHVPAFFIDRTEVTTQEFAVFCRETEGGWPLPSPIINNVEIYSTYPVNYVTCFDAQAYATWKGKALPTLAQWTRAAYGNPDASDSFPWGEEWKDGSANLQTKQIQPIRSFPDDTVAGCFDMAGNVSEWTCSKATHDKGNTAPYFGDEMSVCGGNYLQAQHLRDVTKRPFETRSPELGFRCVLTIDTSPEAVMTLLQSVD